MSNRRMDPKALLAKYHRQHPADEQRNKRLYGERKDDNPPTRSGQAEDVGGGERKGRNDGR